MAATYIPLATTTVSNSSTSSITFSSIPGTYTDLVMIGVMSNQGTAGSVGFAWRVNSDTGNNYSFTYLLGTGSSASSGRFTNYSAGFVAYETNNTANNTIGILQVMNYANSTTYKTAINRASDANYRLGAGVSLWRSTAAITSLTILSTDLGGQNFVSGSTFNLYGIKAA